MGYRRKLPAIAWPYWTRARYNNKCKCGQIININDEIFYRPRSRRHPALVVCKDCGIKWDYDIKAEQSLCEKGTDIF